MRLTLRTLLAYMDDILDPADQEELGRKIEASAFATELIHRSRDAVRRLRLGAPDPLAGDSGEVLEGEGDSHLDANMAAEYLDNTLAPEAVAEFERSCLEAGLHADMLLAEAASCHHILTLVLGEPAEVDADLRGRMYALADRPEAAQQPRLDPAHVSPAPQPVPVATAPVGAAAVTHRPQVDPDEAAVPDYMLEAARTRRRQRRVIIAFVGAAILGGVAAWLLWPQGEPQAPDQVAEMGDVDDLTAGVEIGDEKVDGEDSSAAAPAEDQSTAETEAPAFDPGDTTDETDAPSADAPATDADAAQPTTSPDDAAAGAAAAGEAASAPAASGVAPAAADPLPAGPLPDTTPADPIAPAAAPPAPPSDNQTAGAATPQTPPQTSPQTPPQDPAPTGDASAVPATTNVTPQATPAVPQPSATPVVPPQPAPSDVAAADAMPAAPGDASATPADAKPTPQARQIGAYLGNNDVLLRHDDSSESWLRLPPRSALTPGDRLLALPTFRTHVVLADANAYLGGGTEIQLAGPAANGDATADIRLALPYGRLILNSGLNGNRIELALGNEVRTLTLGPSSSLAIEVQRTLPRGANPERDPLPLHVAWFLTSGTATPDGALEGSDVEAPAAWVTVEGQDQPPQAIEELPHWIDSEPITDTERRARDAVAKAFTPGDAVNIRIAELSDESNLGRLREVRSLAAKSGAYVGEFDPLVKALSDVNQRAYWKSQIEALRAALARDPANMERIHKAFAVQRGQDAADDLLEMLLGFSAEDVGTTREEVKNGDLVRLIRWLEDDDLTTRVLASYNIDEITGTKNLGGYHPEHTADQREREIQYYWNRLEKGELMPKGESRQ